MKRTHEGIERIDDLRKRFHREWLLVAIDEMDEETTTPVRGHILAHSPHRDEIYRRDSKSKQHTLTVYSEDRLPEGYAAAFHEAKNSPC